MSNGSKNEDSKADAGISDTVKKYGPAAAFDISVPVTVAGILGQYFGSSYGPRGADKLIYDKFDNYLLVSNDGGHILEALTDLNGSIAADFVMKWGRSISRRLGDGVKLYFILAGELCNSLNILAGEGINRRLLSEATSFISVLWRYFTDIFALRWDEIAVFESFRNLARDIDVRNTIGYSYRKRNEIGRIIDYLALNPLKGKLSAANTRILADIGLRVAGEVAHYVSKIIDNDNIGAASIFRHFVEVRGLKSTVNKVGIIGPSFNRSFFGKFAVISKEPVNITVADGIIPGWINLLMVKRKLYTDLPDGGSFGPSGPPFEFISEDPETPDIFGKYETRRSRFLFDLFVKDIKPDLIITEKGVERTFESLCTKNGILLIRRADPDEFGGAAEFLGITPLGEGELKPGPEHIKRVYAAYLEMGNKKILTLYKDRANDPKTSDKYGKPDGTVCNGLLKRARISVGTVILTGTMEFTVEAVKKLFDKVLYVLSDFIVKGAVLPDAGCTESAFGLFLKRLSPLLAGESPGSDLSGIAGVMEKIIPCFSEEMKKADTFRAAVDFLGDYINNHTIKLRTKLAYIIDSVADCFHTPLKLLIANSGSDPPDILSRIISLINGGIRAGYDSEGRRIVDCMKAGLFIPVTFKFLPVLYAIEISSLIFGTDRVIRADKFGKIGW